MAWMHVLCIISTSTLALCSLTLGYDQRYAQCTTTDTMYFPAIPESIGVYLSYYGLEIGRVGPPVGFLLPLRTHFRITYPLGASRLDSWASVVNFPSMPINAT